MQRLIAEVAGYDDRRLGRHVNHDPASRSFEMPQAPTIQNVVHTRHGGVLDQGALGSCTGNAIVGLLNTEPYWVPGRELDEDVARLFYSLASRIDGVGGTWPPVDTGSSGLAVAKAAKVAGFVAEYRHTFSLDSALRALQIAPAIIGINWYDSFDNPSVDGVLDITLSAMIRGGHELEVNAVDVDEGLIGGWQSWGDWGPLHGRWWMPITTFGRLLAEQGDVTFPIAARH